MVFARRLVTACGAIVVIAAAGGVGSVAAAAAPAKQVNGVEARCLSEVLFSGFGPAHKQRGSASAGAQAAFSALRRPARSADRFPSGVSLARAVAAAGATTFDPSEVRLIDTLGPDHVFLVPARVGYPAQAARCAHLKPLAGLSALLQLMALINGTGPGVCAIVTTPRLYVSGECLSVSKLISYGTAVSAIQTSEGRWLSLFPDAVTSTTLAYRDGHSRTEYPHLDLARSAGPLSDANLDPRGLDDATIKWRLAGATPTAVRYRIGPANARVSRRRPSWLLRLETAAIRFETGLISGRMANVEPQQR